mmetsp:Transcript_24055/g.45402  ORF Transcript_24055/g.45402 Transcript_24055/m.45402 type:complete len:224 (-) Transcript_24055:732-1403(-)
MVAIGNNFWLHNRYKALALADGRVAGKSMNRVLDGKVAWQPLLRIQLQHIPPLCEASPLGVGLLAPLLQVIQTKGRNFGVPQRTNLGTPHPLLVIGLVHLDSGDHAVGFNDLHHCLAVRIVLEQRLPMKNHATDVFAQARRGETHGPVGSPVLDGVRDLCCFSMACTQPWPSTLVRSQKTFAWSAQLGSRVLQLGQDVGRERTRKATVQRGGLLVACHGGFVD